MTTAENAKLAETAGPWYWPYTYYGVQMSPVGEEGEHLVANGHPEARRVIAAFNWYARAGCGLANLSDDRGADASDVAKIADQLNQTWAVLRMTCSDDCDLGDECSECHQIRSDGGWMFWDRKQTDEGAFPVTVFRWW